MKASYADHALTRPVALRRNSVGLLAAGPPIVASPMGPSSFRYKFGCMKHEGHEEHEAVTKSSIGFLSLLINPQIINSRIDPSCCFVIFVLFVFRSPGPSAFTAFTPSPAGSS